MASKNDILCSAVSPYNTWSSWIPKVHIWLDLLTGASKNFSELPSPTLVYYVPCFICFIFCFENPRKNVSVDLLSFSSLPPPPPHPQSNPLVHPFVTLPIILYVWLVTVIFNDRAREVDFCAVCYCFSFSFGRLEQSFPEDIIKSKEGTKLAICTVCVIKYLTIFSAFVSGYTVNWNRAERER